MTRVTAAVIERDGRVLIARRRSGDRFGGVWEFPGGKIEPGETPEEGLRREIDEELGLTIEVGPAVGTFSYISADWSIELIAFRAAWTGGTMILREHDDARWVGPSELERFAFSEPDRPIVRLLAGEALLHGR
ncbi:MAG: (deoxy)nucleoside triphosphate pyrophosphohydrolase [Candidatus Aminicenantales bacterium]|jgi:8-oxo-dGTP diphosphatase